MLYIFWFLHQTTTSRKVYPIRYSCISFDSYIKPQPWWYWQRRVVRCISFDSYIKPQLFHRTNLFQSVVYLLIPTSNHNMLRLSVKLRKLYIFWFLHQTTTRFKGLCYLIGCISFDSYIKPQRIDVHREWIGVVYLLIPTSNHNCSSPHSSTGRLYIFWFLHQTTT